MTKRSLQELILKQQGTINNQAERIQIQDQKIILLERQNQLLWAMIETEKKEVPEKKARKKN